MNKESKRPLSITLHVPPLRIGRLGILFLGGAGAALCGFMLLSSLRAPKTTAFTRGRDVAERMGCMGCHGPDGMGGVPNPGSVLGEIPPFDAGGVFKFFVQNEAEIREWILEGAPKRTASIAETDCASEHCNCEADCVEEKPIIGMPSYKGLLTDQELDDLAVYVMSLARLQDLIPEEVAKGRWLAHNLGCFACHGMEGRGGLTNPGSFKGVIPPWDSHDFDELVKDEAELREWILDGMIDRFEANPLASFFTNRQVIKMPAYRDLIDDEALDHLVAYVRWIRDDDVKQPESSRLVAPIPAFDPEDCSKVDRGRWLYRKAGCASCHGPKGVGGVPNPNAVGGYVPALDDLAERMELYEPEEAVSFIRLLEHGTPPEELADGPPLPYYDSVLAQYTAIRDVIIEGAICTKANPDGTDPPMPMPSWSERMHADDGPVAEADVDGIIAYLLTLQNWE